MSLRSKPALLAMLFVLSLVSSKSASADIAVRIDLSRQTMNVDVDGAHFATWAVSTARPGYRTPVGNFRPIVLDRMHRSSIYENAPMPYSVFFDGNFAIHGTTEIRNLGRPVSHGCVRLHPANAQALYNLIAREGMQNTSIAIFD
jgi:lipoprotein-anchoring transpeptidase ErfK/SrfK